jgi:hypothetical protein
MKSSVFRALAAGMAFNISFFVCTHVYLQDLQGNKIGYGRAAVAVSP